VTIAEVLKAGWLTSPAGRQVASRQHAGVNAKHSRLQRSLNAPGRRLYYAGRQTRRTVSRRQKLKSDDPQCQKLVHDRSVADYGIKSSTKAAPQANVLPVPHTTRRTSAASDCEDIAEVSQKYKVGWDKLRDERHEKQLKLGCGFTWALSRRPEQVKAGTVLRPPGKIISTKSCDLRPRAFRTWTQRRPLAILWKRGELNKHADHGDERQRRERRKRTGGKLDGDLMRARFGRLSGHRGPRQANTPFRRLQTLRARRRHQQYDNRQIGRPKDHGERRVPPTAGPCDRHDANMCGKCAGATVSKNSTAEDSAVEGKSLLPAFDNKP